MRLDETGWQKDVRLPTGRAAQEVKVALEVMQRGLGLSKAREGVPGGQGWLLTEVPWTDTEDRKREQAVLFILFYALFMLLP